MSDLGNFQSAGPVEMEGISNVTATNSVDLGTRRVVNGETYVYFYNATGSSVTQGAALTVSALSGYSLTRSTTAQADIAICFAKHATVPAANYAWGLVRGLVAPLNVSAISAGILLGIGADGVVQTYLGGSFPTGVCVGKMVGSAVSSTGGGLAFVTCFG